VSPEIVIPLSVTSKRETVEPPDTDNVPSTIVSESVVSPEIVIPLSVTCKRGSLPDPDPATLRNPSVAVPSTLSPSETVASPEIVVPLSVTCKRGVPAAITTAASVADDASTLREPEIVVVPLKVRPSAAVMVAACSEEMSRVWPLMVVVGESVAPMLTDPDEVTSKGV
jgi:hypothetical protein